MATPKLTSVYPQAPGQVDDGIQRIELGFSDGTVVAIPYDRFSDQVRAQAIRNWLKPNGVHRAGRFFDRVRREAAPILASLAPAAPDAGHEGER